VARYYFNLVGHGAVIADRDGVEISGDVSEQVIAAILEEMRSEEPELFVGSGDWSIEVVDEQGHRLAVFPL
jgi:uncharacterized protein DUF6894